MWEKKYENIFPIGEPIHSQIAVGKNGDYAFLFGKEFSPYGTFFNCINELGEDIWSHFVWHDLDKIDSISESSLFSIKDIAFAMDL